jgi:hypothetical protein
MQIEGMKVVKQASGFLGHTEGMMIEGMKVANQAAGFEVHG